MTASSLPLVYQLYVELVDSYPPIWRCFQVPASYTLAQLHSVLQIVMGWSDQQPHGFKVHSASASRCYGPPADLPSQPGLDDEAAIAIAQVFSDSSAVCLYTYDPQDGWLHRLELDTAVSTYPDTPQLYCVDGERACPPEKSGGIWGYEEFLERLNDPEDPDYELLWQQAGSSFNPERLDLAAINRQLLTFLP
jgi:Plasmid pRiA4b ORF-3-like protein